MAEWLVVHTLSVAALAALCVVLCRLFRPRPAARHALWLVVLLKLLTPPLIFWPESLPLPRFQLEKDAIDPPTVTAEADLPDLNEVRVASPVSTAEPIEAELSEPGPSPAPAPGVNRERIAGAAWVVGGVIVAALQAWRIRAFRQRIASGAAAPEWLGRTVAELAAAANVRQPPITVMEDIASPMVWAFGPPRLLWPAGLERQLSCDGIRAVLAHELGHLRRRDHRVCWLLLAGVCVWWWQPLYFLVRRRLSCEAERACDAFVTDLLPAARRAYAEALLVVAQRSSRPAAPALSAASGRRDLERRLTMIMRERVPSRLSPWWMAALLALALVSLPTWTRGQEAARKPVPVDNSRQLPAGEDTPDVPRADGKARLDSGKRGPSRDDRERRLQELESALRSIQKELRDLHGADAVAPSPSGAPSKSLPRPPAVVVPSCQRDLVTNRPPTSSVTAKCVLGTSGSPDSTPAVALSRVAYRLPAGKAEAVAAFLKDHVKAPILETRTEGEALVVTTTPEFQLAIGNLVDLVRGKSRYATTTVPTRIGTIDPTFVPRFEQPQP